ncbi:hypothetical protein GOV08_03685 [Candidatus Woesearchaeota archaeon]|nr:hypothetical protein [Candidatus Woesearchaeota archaeon]
MIHVNTYFKSTPKDRLFSVFGPESYMASSLGAFVEQKDELKTSSFLKAVPRYLSMRPGAKYIPGAAFILFSNTVFTIERKEPLLISLEDMTGRIGLYPFDNDYLLKVIDEEGISDGDKVHTALVRYHKKSNCTTLVDLIKILETPQKDAATNLSFALGFSQ